jgi:hypothetical protein
MKSTSRYLVKLTQSNKAPSPRNIFDTSLIGVKLDEMLVKNTIMINRSPNIDTRCLKMRKNQRDKWRNHTTTLEMIISIALECLEIAGMAAIFSFFRIFSSTYLSESKRKYRTDWNPEQKAHLIVSHFSPSIAQISFENSFHTQDCRSQGQCTRHDIEPLRLRKSIKFRNSLTHQINQ